MLMPTIKAGTPLPGGDNQLGHAAIPPRHEGLQTGHACSTIIHPDILPGFETVLDGGAPLHEEDRVDHGIPLEGGIGLG